MYWIGLSANSQAACYDSKYEWLDGSPFNYEFWSRGYRPYCDYPTPNFGPYSCAYAVRPSMWNTVHCSYSLHVLCQRGQLIMQAKSVDYVREVGYLCQRNRLIMSEVN